MLSGPFAIQCLFCDTRSWPKSEIMSAVINIIIAFPGIKAGLRLLGEEVIPGDNKNIFACLRFKPFQLNKALKWPFPPRLFLAATFLLLPCSPPPLSPFIVCCCCLPSLCRCFASVIVFILCCLLRARRCARDRGAGENKMHINYNQK